MDLYSFVINTLTALSANNLSDALATWIVRDTDNQQQDIAQLSQDTDNAHSTLNKIFDKEKEQNRQQKQQLVGEIGAQVIDLATTVDTIRGTNQAKADSKLDNLSDTAYDNLYQALSETNDNVTERDIQNHLFQQALQDYTNQSDFGTGGKYTRAIQAITAFTQGVMGNNIVTAIANGSAPYLANEVKNQIQGNSVESDIQRTIAHGLLNAGLALAKGENAVVQASGAMTGETVGILSHSLYGKTPEELTETEKQNISAWATLTSGIVGGLISDNSAGVANAAQAGKVVVENNLLGGNELMHTQLAQEYGKDRMSCVENSNSESCQRGKALQQAYIYALATGSTGSVSLLSTSARVMWFIGAGANSGVQYIDSKKVNPVNAIIAGWVNVMTIGEGWKSTVFFNAAGGALTNTINDESAAMGAITTGSGALMGYGLGNFIVKPVTNWVGKIITKGNNPRFNEVLRKYSESEVKGRSYIMQEVSESKISSGAGNLSSSAISELGVFYIQKKDEEEKKE